MNKMKLSLLAALLGGVAVTSHAQSSDTSRDQRMDQALQNYRSGGARAEDSNAGPAERAENSMKRGAHRAGDSVKHGAQKAGHAVGTGMRKTGDAIERAGKKTQGAAESKQ